MGRKSRAKRTRREATPPETRSVVPEAPEAITSAVPQDGSTSLQAAGEPARTRSKRNVEEAYPGARVARVAVDDATWTAFRDLCGATPASSKLGQLVRAEVQRGRDLATRDADPETAIREIRAQVTELERYLQSNS